jgi:hypothetical protein
MLHGQAEPRRRAVIEDVDGVAIEPNDFSEAVDRLRDPLEGVIEIAGFAATGHVGSAEARQIGSDNLEAIGQERDQIAEHVTGTGEAMEQQQLGGVRRACSTIEDVKPVYVGSAVLDGGHGKHNLSRASSQVTEPSLARLDRWGRAATPGKWDAATPGSWYVEFAW